ncbi:MAG: MFS transporter [Deltaproteobacteria bacterium]|nr:MFS transporter [Deltaproteobacteria bacterium]
MDGRGGTHWTAGEAPAREAGGETRWAGAGACGYAVDMDSGAEEKVPPPSSVRAFAAASATLATGERPMKTTCAPDRAGKTRPEWAAVPPAYLMLVYGAENAAVINFLPVFAEERGMASAAEFFAISVFGWLTSRLFDSMGHSFAMPLCMALVAASLLLVLTAPVRIVTALAAVLFGLGSGAVFPTLMTLAMTSVGPVSRTTASAYFSSRLTSAWARAPWPWGAWPRCSGGGPTGIRGIGGPHGLHDRELLPPVPPKLRGPGRRGAGGGRGQSSDRNRVSPPIARRARPAARPSVTGLRPGIPPEPAARSPVSASVPDMSPGLPSRACRPASLQNRPPGPPIMASVPDLSPGLPSRACRRHLP